MIEFGRDTICPTCRRRDRRKLPYASGKIEMSLGMAKSLGRKIINRWGAYRDVDTVTVECPTCQGRGFVRT